ncbi:MAG: FkbM family methyltransferase [Clostridium sp.]|nr:FkbM family methyltransferase [Clostridium sp.]
MYEEKPAFIKTDIDGAGTEALKGSEKIIKTFETKLAICIYHKPEDLFKIPILIKEMRGDYKIFIRQYEIICYAV